MFSFFTGRSVNHPHTYASIRTDFITHLIPEYGVDDLDKIIYNLKSIEMLGFKKVIVTPPVKSFKYPNSFEQILKSYQLIKDRVDTEKIVLQLEIAVKYFLNENFEELLQKNKLLIFGKKYVLISLPFNGMQRDFRQVFRDLAVNGYVPVISHPERHPYFLNKMDRLILFKDMGCLFQTDLLSLTGIYGEAVRKFTLEIISKKMVNFVSSNLYNQEHTHLILALPPSIQKILREAPLLNNTL